MRDDFKIDNLLCIIDLLENQSEERAENMLEEIIRENFSTLKKDKKIQEAQRVPNPFNSNVHASRYVIVKSERRKDKENILKHFL